MTWLDSAGCRGMDTGIFFPLARNGSESHIYRPARAVCDRCQVVTECLEDALESEGRLPMGMRGGLNPVERLRIREQRRRGMA